MFLCILYVFKFFDSRMLCMKVPAKAEEITIPADVTPERVPTHIIDYSGGYSVIKAFCAI
jgi:hypothetical protein